MDSVKMFKMLVGEMVITRITDVDDEGKYLLDYPAVVVPIPPDKAGGMANQIGFTKYLPFSDYSEDISLNPDMITINSVPTSQLVEAYDKWVTQIKAQESGIVLPNQGAAAGFNQLNT